MCTVYKFTVNGKTFFAVHLRKPYTVNRTLWYQV